MEAWPGGGGETVTLIRYGPRVARAAPPRPAARKAEKFSFKFRRRSKSAPRHCQPSQVRAHSPEVRPITYTANGERVRHSDSPLHRGRSEGVELTGFTSYGDPAATATATDTATPGDSRSLGAGRGPAGHSLATLARTSKQLKMERERVRQERLAGRWAARRGLDAGPVALAEERAKFFDEARERFHSTNSELLAGLVQRQEQDGRLLGPGRAFPPGEAVGGGRAGGQEARVIPIAVSTSPPRPATPEPLPAAREGERIIPVRLETDSSSSDSSSSTSSASSTTESPVHIVPALPALMGDLRLGDSLLRQGRASFHHPSFANHFGFSRLPAFPADSLLSSFPGFPAFGSFPAFQQEEPAAAKPRLGKSKSTSEYGADGGTRFPGPPDPGSPGESQASPGYGDSEEEESEEEELDSVSVVCGGRGLGGRDRLSGTGSTHSSGSTHSADSGIPEDEPRLRTKLTEAAKRRPESAVPSEYSVVSDSSSCSGQEAVEKEKEGEKEKEAAGPEAEAERRARLGRVHAIAKELLETEKHYVSVLHLIDQVFHARVAQDNKSQSMFGAETLTTVFSNVKSIYKFHAEFLLPQLEARMAVWPEGPEYQRIGDIMVRNAPFLKMYTEYVKNFDTAMTAIGALYGKNRQFQAIMDEIHALPECRSLTLQHHMLSPIQRIPRYELLLKEYIARLPEDSPDRSDSQSALLQVSQAAAHANDSMKRIDQFKKLLEVQESIGGGIDLVSPTREVLKEGRIVKISARTGDHQERFLFLLSDLLLLCSPRKSMMAGAQFGLRARFEVDSMQVLEGDNLVTANTFYIRDAEKCVELYTGTREEKEAWLEQLFSAVKSLYTRKSSLRVGREILRPLDSEIGKRQPHMQRLETVARCTDCATQFSILKHKHNCRFCGAVFCGKCTESRQPLPWEDGRKARVCRACFQVLTSSVPAPPTPELPVRPRGLLEVPASHPAAVRSGWLVLRPPGSKAQSYKRFFLLLPDFVLYSFRSTADLTALTATPLPGSTVLTGPGLKGDSGCAEKDREKVVKLVHGASRRTYYLAATSGPDMEQWAEVLGRAARAEPTVTQSDSRSTSSVEEFENS